MRTTLKLFKLQIDELYDFFKTKNIKKFIWSIVKYVLLISVLSVVLYYLLLQIFILGFTVNTELISIVLLLTQGISLLFATGNIISTLFLNKNNEFLLSLPASSNQIFYSKIMVIYIQEIIVNSIFTLPLLISFGVLGGFGLGFYLLLPIFMIILPLLPISIASLISIPFMYVLKYLKRHPVVSIILLVGSVCAGIFIYIGILSSFASSFNITNKLIETIREVNSTILSFGGKNWLFLKLGASMIYINQLYWALVYIGIGVITFLGTMLLIKPFYFKTAMSNSETAVASKIKPRRYKKLSPLMSLMKKEFLTVFRSPGYVFQFFIFTLLMPVIVVLYDRLLLMLVVNQVGQMMIAGSHVLIVAVLAMLSNIISASAISREGGTFYLIKIAPINFYVQTTAKLLFNVLFTSAAVIITAIVTFFYLSPIIVIFTTLSVLLVSVGHICLSYDFDLKKPTLDWYDTGEISKINNNTTKSIISGLALALIMGLVIILLSATQLTILPWLVLLILSLAFCAYRLYILVLRVFYQYDKLEM